MEISNYEFMSLDIEASDTSEGLYRESMNDYLPECQLMLQEFLYEQPSADGIPISIIQNCLKQIEN